MFLDVMFTQHVERTEVGVIIHPDDLNVRHLQVWGQRSIQVLVEEIIELGVIHAIVYTLVYTLRQLLSAARVPIQW